MADPIVSPGGGVTVVVTPPFDFIARQLGKLAIELEDLDPLWNRIEPAMAQIEQDQFETRGHGGWPPLAPSTLADKARHGYPEDPLVRTGDLKESLTNPAVAAHRTHKQLTWGTDIPYAPYHQTGTPRMPKRPPLDLRAEDRQKLEAAVVSWINKSVAKHWGARSAAA